MICPIFKQQYIVNNKFHMKMENFKRFKAQYSFLCRKEKHFILSIYIVMQSSKPDGEIGQPRWRWYQTTMVIEDGIKL